MKKLVIVLATLGLMFNVIGCKAKKAQDDTEIIENADVEKIEAEEANFAGSEATLETGPVDESLQAALGEVPSEEAITTSPSSDPVTDAANAAASTEVVSTEITPPPEMAAAPVIDETSITPPSSDVAAMDPAALVETPILESPVPPVEIAQSPTDMSLNPETTISGGVSEMTGTPPLADSSIIESSITPPVDASTVISTERAEKFTSDQVSVASTTTSNKGKLLKLSESTPYQHGEGFVNTVYNVRPKEKLAEISMAIYGVDKTKELKDINSFLKSRGPRAGDKVYYVSPNRPTDSARTLSFYEDTGMIASTYTSEKGENLAKISKKLLGYDNAWKEIWTTNELESKTKLAKGETIRYWRGKDIVPTTPTLANLDGNAKLVDTPEQMPVTPPQEVAMNTAPPAEMAPPVAQELPPPPPMPEEQVAPPAEMAPPVAQELPPPPAEMAPPPPPAEEMAAAPMPPKKGAHMEEEPMAEEGGLNSDAMTMMGVVAVLVSLLGMVLIRRNKKKKEAEMSSIETHVGT